MLESQTDLKKIANNVWISNLWPDYRRCAAPLSIKYRKIPLFGFNVPVPSNGISIFALGIKVYSWWANANDEWVITKCL